MSLLTDLSPLRESRDYRLLFWGRMASRLGTQFTVVAAPVQVWDLTESTLAVGMLGLAQLPPLLMASFLGGQLADAMDRRKLLLYTQLALMVSTALLALNAMLSSPQLWAVYVVTALIAALSGIDSPTTAAVTPTLVTKEQLPAALALNQVMFQMSSVVGLTLGGLLASRDIAMAYWVDVFTFVASLLAVFLMSPLLPEGGGTKLGWASAVEGWRYLRDKAAVQGAFVIDLNAMVFGMPRALFPEMAARTFDAPGAVGLMFAAPALGAFIGAATTGWLERVDNQGRGVVLSVMLWGASMAAFGFSPWLASALFFLALAGWADVVSAVMRNTIIQLAVPDRLRGRLSALHIANVTGGPRLGDAESGVVAAATNVRVSAWSGGLACMVGAAACARAFPALTTWRMSNEGQSPDA